MTDILILAALREEIAKMRPIDGAVIATTGDGALRAGRGAADAIERVRPGVVVGIGIAGALSPDLKRGDIVVARTIVEGDHAVECDSRLVDAALTTGAKTATLVASRSIAGVSAKRQLAATCSGPAAVDLESAAWQRAAAARGLPFVSVRCILDAAAEELPQLVARSVRADGSIRRAAVVARALAAPWHIGALLRLRRQTAEAATALARFVERFIEAIRDSG